jgi:electron-transferring-flavoprotein dehydrogenase
VAGDRQRMDVDVVCVGFGPATGGFLTTLAREAVNADGTPHLESRVAPGMPLQVLCFERADDLGVGVSGVVTRARGIRRSFPDFNPSEIPLTTRVAGERLVYLLDPIGASRRSRPLRALDAILRAGRGLLLERDAFPLPLVPPFLQKHDGLVLSLGQFSQWVSGQVMASGVAQIWPASPVVEPLFESDRVAGVRLVDQGTDLQGEPAGGFTLGMDVFADLTVVGDGPFGAAGRMLDDRFGLPEGHVRDEWALGMKMVVDLRDDVELQPGTVLHTFGFPEPEIFGFLYVLAPRTVSLGIFVPSWFRSPVRTAYRYLQHWMMHPYLWRWLEGGTLRSWGAKSVQESGRRGEPYLVGDGYGRIGEGSGSTNALTGSGVDEAWTTGVQLAEAVVELAKAGEKFTKTNLERTYVKRRRASWVEKELRIAEGARDGFERGVLWGLVGMGLSGLTGGAIRLPGRRHPGPLSTLDDYFSGRIPADEIARVRQQSLADGSSMHDAFMDRIGWPAIPYDGRLLVTHQDALLVGGKVQAPAGYANHVRFEHDVLCRTCQTHLCADMCSGQAIRSAPEGGVAFDREKCVHCGACLWNCVATLDPKTGRTNVIFRAGTGGLHSVEN